MQYFPADEYGTLEFPGAGLMYMDRPIVLDESGTLRHPSPDDPPGEELTFTTTLGVDPHGRVTFFHGTVFQPGSPLARRCYVWGYAPGTVQTRGSIGGPRSPVAPREPPPPQMLKGGTGLRFGLACDAENDCRVTVGMSRDDRRGIAVTYFRANRLGEDLRYFPSEKEGGTELVGGAATWQVDLDVVVEQDGALRDAEPWDAPADVKTLSTTLALDGRGHVTFFYGFLRDPDSSHVTRFCIWGYPPGTLMVDRPEADEGSEEARPRPDRRI